MAPTPAAPVITINAPDTHKPAPGSQDPEEKQQAAKRKVIAIAPPAELQKEQGLDNDTCYLCDEQNPGDFSPTTKFLDACLLCTRAFCPIHKGQWDQVCNINHSTYYHKHRDLPDVYPSLGEREKALFSSPVTLDDATKRAIEAFRGTTASKLPESDLVEEKDFVGADIAI